MKKLTRISILGLLAALAVFGQANTLTQTTTAAAMTANSRTISLTSATGISAGVVTSGTVGTQLFVVDFGQTRGEVMNVLSISGTLATVSRTASAAVAHASGAMVLASQPNNFYKFDPTGSCVTASTQVTPWVNTLNGNQWLCSTVSLTWVPGFGNLTATPQSTLTVASAAGATAVSGPFFTVSGTNAITGWTVPVGGAAGAGFCVAPSGNFTWTTAGNIGLAGTAVTGRILCFVWDKTSGKYLPSYV